MEHHLRRARSLNFDPYSKPPMAEDGKFERVGLTYDDVLLTPGYSEVIPREADTSTRFTRRIPINTPIVSASMDTVTESRLAIAIAQEGGIGVIHKNMGIDEQAKEVRKVKRSESGMILDPITLNDSSKVGDALRLMADNSIGGIPVVDEKEHLIGIVTNRDLRFEKDKERPVQEVMTREGLVSTDEETDLEKAETILQKHRIEKLPVVDQDKKLVGLITYRDIIKIKEHPDSCKDEYGRLRVAAAVGVTQDTEDRSRALFDAGVDAIVIDTAHGHTHGVLETVRTLRKAFPDLDLVAGNIGTAEAAAHMVECGVDAVKVGIGPGSICTTRVIAGVGVPQLTAVNDVAQALEGTDVPLIADGGIRYTGDLVKALAAGADSVMIGSLFAGVEESPGETIIYEGRKYKAYRGMGSIEAMEEGSKDRYFQDAEDDIQKLVPEGISGRVPYKGRLSEIVYQMVGGLRAGMGYCGAPDLQELKKARFLRITNAGIREGHPHDVTISREAPNYSVV